jgi:sec-independent protein translocase protein TatA
VEFSHASQSHRIAPAITTNGHRSLDLFEIALILAIALIVIGPERLPEVMRTVGKVLRELRLASNTVLHELTDVLEEPPAKALPPAPEPAPPSAQPTSAVPPEKT